MNKLPESTKDKIHRWESTFERIMIEIKRDYPDIAEGVWYKLMVGGMDRLIQRVRDAGTD